MSARLVSATFDIVREDETLRTVTFYADSVEDALAFALQWAAKRWPNEGVLVRPTIVTQRGQAVVELCLVFPILCTLLLAIVGFGTTFKDYIALEDATRAGARVAQLTTDNAEVDAAVRKSATGLRLMDVEVAVERPENGDVIVTARYPWRVSLILASFGGTLDAQTTFPRDAGPLGEETP